MLLSFQEIKLVKKHQFVGLEKNWGVGRVHFFIKKRRIENLTFHYF